MGRRLSAEERALWRKVTATVRPLARALPDAPQGEPEPHPVKGPSTPRRRPTAAPPPAAPPTPGSTLDASWDRRLLRGLVQPDLVVDLHGHGLAAAHALLERKLEQAIAVEARLLLLVTGRPPRNEDRPVRRGAIRASVGDWLAASPHAGAIAAIRGAHPRHGGAGALYIVLRRRRPAPS